MKKIYLIKMWVENGYMPDMKYVNDEMSVDVGGVVDADENFWFYSKKRAVERMNELKRYSEEKGWNYEFDIDDSSSISSYELRDIICDKYDLEPDEITAGRNGYPHNLRGCVLLGGNNFTIDEMEYLAEKFGVELVSLRRKDGWNLWEKRGWTSELYDYQDFLMEHDDNIVTFGSYAEYADYLRETAESVDDEDEKQDLLDTAESVKGRELEDNEFIFVNTYDITDYDTHRIKVDHFYYDTWHYELALDCSVE